MPGALASSCNPATWRQVLLDGLREGLLVAVGSKAGRTGPEGKPSSQESLCGSVVG